MQLNSGREIEAKLKAQIKASHQIKYSWLFDAKLRFALLASLHAISSEITEDYCGIKK